MQHGLGGFHKPVSLVFDSFFVPPLHVQTAIIYFLLLVHLPAPLFNQEKPLRLLKFRPSYPNTMSIQKLPTELLNDICQNVSVADLLSLSRTSGWLYPVAQRLLYRHICVAPSSRNLRVVLTLANSPTVARYVRTFSISIDVYSPIFASFYRILAQALTYMSELTSLDLFVDSSSSWVLQPPPREYSGLQHFACSFPLDAHVTAFLGKTPNLLELEVDSMPLCCSVPIPPLPAFAVPRLAQFIGSCRAAKAIVPGRPLESIHLNSGDLSEDEISALSKGTARMVVLGASTSFLPVPFLDLLAHHLPHLVYLRIMTTYKFSKAPDVEFYKEIAHRLAALPDLSAFELSGMNWGSRKKSNDCNERVWQSMPLSVDLTLGAASVDPDMFIA
jgi:hypothetical protein